MLHTFTPIGIIGKAGAGKSVVSRALSEHFGAPVVPFVRSLNAMAEPLFADLGLDPALLTATQVIREIPRAELGGLSVRQFQQKLGTEFGRDMVSPRLWVNAWRGRCMRCAINAFVIADGTRFAEEVAAIHDLDGITVGIIRPDSDHGTSAATQSHKSENAIQAREADVVLVNDGTAADLAGLAIKAVTSAIEWRGSGARSAKHSREANAHA